MKAGCAGSAATRRLSSLILIAAAIVCAPLPSPGEAATGKLPLYDRAVFDTGLENSGMILQDRDGFIWIASNGNGLFRFDGYQLKAFTADRPGSLPDPQVQALYEDREGIIWIGTMGCGLVSYDKRTDAFRQYRHDPADPSSLGGDAWSMSCGNTIAEDADGTLWVANRSGLNAMDRSTGTFRRYRHDPSDPGSLSNDSVRDILLDRSGALWVATEGGLNRLDRKSGGFTRYVPGLAVNSIDEDRDGLIWLATRGNGLMSLDPRTGAFLRYAHDPRNPNSPSDDLLQQVYEDGAGTLWLAYMNHVEKCISTFDKRTGTFTHYVSRPDDPGTPSANSVIRIYEDRTGTLWFLCHSGVADKLDRRKPAFRLYRREKDNPRSLSSDIIPTLYADSGGRIWIGAFLGVNVLDGASRTFARLIDSVWASAFLEDSAGMIWVGISPPGTLNLFDRKQGRIVKTYRPDPADPSGLAPNDFLYRILEDRDDPGVLWLALNGSGVDRFDKRSGTFTHYLYSPEDPEGLAGKAIQDVFQDRDGRLWVCIAGGGLNALDPRTGKTVPYKHDPSNDASLASDAVFTAFEDSAGKLWVGTAVGFDMLDRSTGVFTHYGAAKGVPSATVGSIVEAEDGRLWMGTMGAGLIRFDPRTEAVRVFTESDGLQGNVFYPRSGVRGSGGEMWFGGTRGLTGFFPEEIIDNAFIPPIVLTSLKQGGEEMALRTAPERARKITLGWRDNFFEFEYAALSYTGANRNLYRYRLEGLDKDWYEAGTRRFGRYSGLRGGDYVLRVIGSNNDGVWNTDGVALKVTVLPPWWQAWWFYALCAAAAAGAVLLFLRSKNRQLAAARESERRYRDVFNATSDALFIYDESGRVLDVNESMCAMYRCAREQALLTDFGDRSENVPPYTITEAKEKIKLAMQVKPQVFEWRSRRMDGEVFWSEVILHACEIAGKKRAIGSVRDISARKRAEEMLRQSEQKLSLMVKMGKMGYWEYDEAAGAVTATGQLYSILRVSAEKMGGYTVPATAYAGRFLHSEDVAPLIADMTGGSTAEGPLTGRRMEHRIRHDDGSVGYVSMRCVAERDADGRLTAVRGVMQDITELKRAEQAVRTLNEELEKRVKQRTAQYDAANRELEAFAYSVSHDLRAPLRAIDGFTLMLMEKYALKLGSEGQRLCAVIRDSTARMERLINDLLGFSRVSHVDLKESEVDMAAMASAALAELVPQEDRGRISVEVSELPRAMADPSLIRQVWQNLLSNALKFSSKRGHPRIEVGGSAGPEGATYWVRDNGTGFDMDYADKLFGVFQRLHSEDDFPGTGVGLAIVQRILSRHGGTIRAHAAPDNGATFTFTLPARIPKARRP